MDRFLALTTVGKSQLQILAAACLLLASKLREPSVRGLPADLLVFYTDNSITTRDLIVSTISHNIFTQVMVVALHRNLFVDLNWKKWLVIERPLFVMICVSVAVAVANCSIPFIDWHGEIVLWRVRVRSEFRFRSWLVSNGARRSKLAIPINLTDLISSSFSLVRLCFRVLFLLLCLAFDWQFHLSTERQQPL